MVDRYGKLNSEEEAEEILVARNIVKEIVKYGVNEKQKLNVIRFLSMELENSEHMSQLVETIKKLNQKTLIVDSVNDNDDEEEG